MPCTLEDLLQKTKEKVQLAERIKAQRNKFSGKIKFDYIERCLRVGVISPVPSGGGEHTWMRKYMLNGLHVVVNHRTEPPQILDAYWARQTEPFVCEAVRKFEDSSCI